MHTVGDTSSSVPAFLGKLWKLVEDPSTNHLISWNPNGVSFTIRDQARFARELLPLYYKHNNMASFVRQLNMYGFHKVVSVDSGGLKLDKDEMEFAHMYFLQGQEFLLEHIKRKIPISKQDDGKHAKPEVFSRVLAEVRGLKGKQENVDTRLAAMKQENQALWREVAALRQKHMKQQQIVNKLIQFLLSIVQPNRAGLGLKRRYPLMIGEAIRPPSSSTDAKVSNKNVGAKQAKQEPGRKGQEGFDMSNVPTVPILSSGGGPTIHDVTDIMDDVEPDLIEDNEDEGDVVEAAESPETATEILPETLVLGGIDAQVADHPTRISEDLPTDGSLAEELVSTEQPDFNTMVELETGGTASSPNLLDKAMAGIASPLSPELLNAVDPREINDGALLSFEKNRNGKGKSQAGKPDMSVAGIPANTMERDELDNHLDEMQMDLEQLREVLTMQGNPLDAATLLGLFSADDALAGSSYLSAMDMDMFRAPNNGNITGNEVIAYGSPGMFEEVQPTTLALDGVQNNISPESIVEDGSVDLLDLLDEAPIPVASTTAASIPTKRKKRN